MVLNNKSEVIFARPLTQQASVGVDGTINVQLVLQDVAKRYPLAISISIEVTVRSSSGVLSVPGQSPSIPIIGIAPEMKLYENLFDPTKGGSAKVRYELPEDTEVKITLHDLTGRLIKVLREERVPAGVHVDPWDGRNAGGEVVASGTYLVVIQAGSYRETKKVIIVK